MKMNTLEKAYVALLNMEPEIILPEPLRQRAEVPIVRMLELGRLAPMNLKMMISDKRSIFSPVTYHLPLFTSPARCDGLSLDDDRRSCSQGVLFLREPRLLRSGGNIFAVGFSQIRTAWADGAAHGRRIGREPVMDSGAPPRIIQRKRFLPRLRNRHFAARVTALFLQTRTGAQANGV